MYQKHRWLWIVTALFYLVAGGIILYNPGANLASLTILFTVIMMISGIIQIFIYFEQPKEFRKGSLLAWGLITVLMSIWILSSNYITLELIIPYAFAFWVLMGSTTKLIIGIESKSAGFGIGGIFILLGIIGIVIGILLLYHPVLSGMFINYLVVILFIYEAISALINFKNSKSEI